MSLVSDWPTAVAHVDADCFYASCERARHPRLRDRPVCVLSSQDACVVASEISTAVSITPDLFGVMARDERQGALFETLDAINLKYGSGTALMLASLPVKRHGKSRRFRYPLIEVG